MRRFFLMRTSLRCWTLAVAFTMLLFCVLGGCKEKGQQAQDEPPPSPPVRSTSDGGAPEVNEEARPTDAAIAPTKPYDSASSSSSSSTREGEEATAPPRTLLSVMRLEVAPRFGVSEEREALGEALKGLPALVPEEDQGRWRGLVEFREDESVAQVCKRCHIQERMRFRDRIQATAP